MNYSQSGYEAQLVEIGNLPLYNEDIDTESNAPAEYTTFRNAIKESDAVLFVTPEYNRSISGALKNALDVGSRPYGQSAWDGKPAAVISQSDGKFKWIWCKPSFTSMPCLFKYANCPTT